MSRQGPAAAHNFTRPPTPCRPTSPFQPRLHSTYAATPVTVHQNSAALALEWRHVGHKADGANAQWAAPAPATPHPRNPAQPDCVRSQMDLGPKIRRCGSNCWAARPRGRWPAATAGPIGTSGTSDPGTVPEHPAALTHEIKPVPQMALKQPMAPLQVLGRGEADARQQQLPHRAALTRCRATRSASAFVTFSAAPA